MYIYFDPDNSVDWVHFFENEVNQDGSGGFRAGSLYQRGNGPFSQLLGKLFISAVPLLKRLGVSVGQEVLDSSLRVANDVATGDSFKQSLSENASKSYNSLVNRAIGKLDQSGGRPRKKKSITKSVKKKKAGGRIRKQTKKKKAKPNKKRTLQKSILNKKDIFGKWQN
uniref:Uncharacterized protein n=1 Tax=Caenorhabditis tropicalis TaxID=1561998 RepID=A0A1I7U808_9PELO